MRKLAVSLAASAFALCAAPASQAAVEFCIDFGSFCDGIQFRVNDNFTIDGTWVNTDCAGASAQIFGGLASGDQFNIACGDPGRCPAGLAWMFTFNHPNGAAAGKFDMIGSDGVNPPFGNLNDWPYLMTVGACSFSEAKRGLPASTW